MIPGRALPQSLALLLVYSMAAAQAPKPFPQPTESPSTPTRPAPSQPTVSSPATQRPGAASDVPTEATLGAPIYPGAQFLASYDAGRGQRFYLFGVSAGFAEMVNFYRNALKQKGDELFITPPTHQFETVRFREQTMAFPPSVTIKDYTWGGSAGYPNPRRGTQPERFATIIQIVNAPPGTLP
jgi:hypothetical protein